MDRLQFLKACGISVGASVLAAKPIALPAAAAPEPRFRPAPGGRILVADAHSAWTEHANFGPEFEVREVRQGSTGITAELRFQGQHAIRLQLDPNGRDWKTL